MSLRCYIVDNEDYAIEYLSKHIRKTPGLELVGSDTNPLESLKKITTGEVKADISFLDIEMPQLSGLELAALIQAQTHIVFTTAHREFALQAFDTGAVDYLVKPIRYERFLKTVNTVRKIIAGDPSNKDTVKDFIFIQSENKGKLIRIKINDILMVEGALNYVRIKMVGEQTYLTHVTLSEMEGTLPDRLFMRVHRGFLINMDKVAFLEDGIIHLNDGTTVTLGDNYKKPFLARVNEHLLKGKRKQ